MLAAASFVRVAVVALGPDRSAPGGGVSGAGEAGEVLLTQVATWAGLHSGAADPLSLDEAVALVSTLAETHGLVLLTGAPGLLVPVGPAGWTAVDLAAALGAPVAVAADTGADGADQAALALALLDARGLTAAVLTTGAEQDASLDTLPVVPAGHIPAHLIATASSSADSEPVADPDAVVAPDSVAPQAEGSDPGGEGDFAAIARAALHPMLHASTGRRKEHALPVPVPPIPAPRPTSSGTRAVLLIGAVFVTLSLIAVGMAFRDRSKPVAERYATVEVSPGRGEIRTGARLVPPPPTVARPPGAPVRQVCPENQLREAPPEPGAAVTARVDAAWQRIEKWLAAEAPGIRTSLRPPARAADVARVQQRMSVPFPPDLVASLQRHDGVTAGGFTLPFMHRPMSIAEIPGDWRTNCDTLADTPGPDSGWWDRQLVPFAATGDGGSLVVDQRPGRHGRVGEWFHETGPTFEAWPASVVELLEQTATSLETGKPFADRWTPAIAGGRLEWKPA